MSDSPTRIQIIETARELVLLDGSSFSFASVYRRLNCPPSNVRRYFPTKAKLVSAIFDRIPEQAVPAGNAGSRVAEEAPFTPATNAELDWVERRFRIFERAVATLENKIESVRTENAKSLTQLDKKWLKIVGGLAKAGTDSSQIPKILGSFGTNYTDEKETTLNNVPHAHFGSIESGGSFVSDLNSECSDLPPRISAVRRSSEALTSEFDINNQEPELVFTTAPDPPPTKDSWRQLVVFGLGVFLTLVTVFVVVFVLTNRAGASYASAGVVTDHHDKAQNPASSDTLSMLQRVHMGDCIAVNVAAPTTPNSLANTLSAQSLHLEQATTVDHSAPGGSLNCDPRTKLQFALAYLKGDGVKADPMMAAFWSEAAAQQGEADAQFVLGTLYAEGIKPNPSQAYHWFSSAAVQGNPKAMHNLAIALLNGLGVAKDQSSAVSWFVRAANLGYRDSAFNLGVLYERGEGVAQDPRQALFWYDAAAANGDAQAVQRAAVLRENGFSVQRQQ